MKSMSELLEMSNALHHHLCPCQVIGVWMGLWAGELLGLDLPQSGKRLLTIVETDGCFADGVAVATGCWVGHRTLRIEDYGRVAATLVDTKSGNTVRIAPHSQARQKADSYASEAGNHWKVMLQGYQHMPISQ
jgi:formylmethanofuran dehydrogenase subunit E